jgi:adenine-specific DNA-methyltransferase
MPTLNWHKREEAVRAATRAPYRLLEPVAELSYGDADSENLLIQGDNLDALKALLPYYAGCVKCIAIDPPYNTRSAFQHYDDNLEHSTWLSLMYPRLELLRDLLAENGSIWVNIDDFELHYLKVLMDEVFGQKNFVTTIVWQMRTSRENRRVFSNNHEYMLVYAKDPERWAELRNDLELTDEVRKRYKNPDNDPRGLWQSVSANAQAGHGTPNQFYTLVAPNGKKHDLPKGTCWRYTEKRTQEEIAANNIWFGKDGKGVPRMKRFLSEAKAGLTPETLWLADEVGTNDFAKKALLQMFREEAVFETPKPETLLQRVIHIATNPDDLVLDSFLGSGTTAAVAHKMGRRWIGIELGDHAVTHCVPRLKKVVDGEQGGISEAVGWKGGGGFRFCRLGPPIFDENDHIKSEIRFPVLAAHVWFSETHTPLTKAGKSALLGIHNDTAYYLLYNGILGDKRPGGGNVLTGKVLGNLTRHDGPKVIYGECTSLGEERLRREGVVFKQIPYDVKRR